VRAHTYIALLALCILFGTTASAQNSASRTRLSVSEALFGEWSITHKTLLGKEKQSDTVYRFYSDGRYDMVSRESIKHLNYEVLEINNSQNWIRIYVTNLETGRGHEMLIEFADDKRKAKESIFLAYTNARGKQNRITMDSAWTFRGELKQHKPVPEPQLGNCLTLQEAEFAISIPRGWTKVPRSTLHSHVRSLQNQSPNLDSSITHFEYAYQMSSDKSVLSLPAVLIQIQKGPDRSRLISQAFPEMKRYLDAVAEDLSQKMPSLAEARAEKIVYDRDKQTLWFLTETQHYDYTRISSLTVIYLRQDMTIHVICNSVADELHKHLPDFQRIAQSLQPVSSVYEGLK